MKNKIFIIFSMIFILFFWVDSVLYSNTTFTVGKILISNPRIITQRNNKKNISVVFELINKGKTQESLVRARILTAENFLFNGTFDIDPGEEIQFKRFLKYATVAFSGYDLYVGDRIPINLFFRNNGSILVFAEVMSGEN